MHELFQLSTYAVKKASDVILKYYNSSYEVQMKGKGNPVTNVPDHLMDAFTKDYSGTLKAMKNSANKSRGA